MEMRETDESVTSSAALYFINLVELRALWMNKSCV
jgi:hypothetical protein